MITLGHNSSAVFYDGTETPIGYEEERLNGVKSSSAFPQKSIEMIIDNIDPMRLNGGTIYVSHWFDTFEPRFFPEKYYDLAYVTKLQNRHNMKLVLVSKEFTHHDAHAYSSLAFMENNPGADTSKKADLHFIVADGFGNNKEVISIYTLNSGSLKLIGRVYGYESSIGLLYQYATSFCGMKEMQDEYKFLGYESVVGENVSEKGIIYLKQQANRLYDHMWINIINTSKDSTKSKAAVNYLNTLALQSVKIDHHERFSNIMTELTRIEGYDGLVSNTFIRSAIGFVIQSCVESIMSNLIRLYDIKNVVLSGGCFYNVKLNHHILNTVKGQVCVLPVAGDQGAAIGLYRKHIGLFNFSDLCFGKRKLSSVGMFTLDSPVKFINTENNFVYTVADLLDEGYIVNIMHGNMEFGPRALCNTSTLAMPTKENVAYINMLNNRNTIMPMAPVLLQKYSSCIFNSRKNVDRVIGSTNYMVMTLDVSKEFSLSDKYQGIIHKYPLEDRFSARPQIVRDRSSIIGRILDECSSLCLINTSFNTHGTPILFSVHDAVRDFKKQRILDHEDKSVLIILTDD